MYNCSISRSCNVLVIVYCNEHIFKFYLLHQQIIADSIDISLSIFYIWIKNSIEINKLAHSNYEIIILLIAQNSSCLLLMWWDTSWGNFAFRNCIKNWSLRKKLVIWGSACTNFVAAFTIQEQVMYSLINQTTPNYNTVNCSLKSVWNLRWRVQCILYCTCYGHFITVQYHCNC